MNDVVQAALIAGLSSVLSSSGTLGLTLFFTRKSAEEQHRWQAEDKRQENNEWYSRTLFKNRLRAVHEGYAWILKIIQHVGGVDRDSVTTEMRRTLSEMCSEAREWYGRNAIYLEGRIPRGSDFLGLINAAPNAWNDSSTYNNQVADALKWITSCSDSVMNFGTGGAR